MGSWWRAPNSSTARAVQRLCWWSQAAWKSFIKIPEPWGGTNINHIHHSRSDRSDPLCVVLPVLHVHIELSGSDTEEPGSDYQPTSRFRNLWGWSTHVGDANAFDQTTNNRRDSVKQVHFGKRNKEEKENTGENQGWRVINQLPASRQKKACQVSLARHTHNQYYYQPMMQTNDRSHTACQTKYTRVQGTQAEERFLSFFRRWYVYRILAVR